MFVYYTMMMMMLFYILFAIGLVEDTLIEIRN